MWEEHTRCKIPVFEAEGLHSPIEMRVTRAVVVWEEHISCNIGDLI